MFKYKAKTHKVGKLCIKATQEHRMPKGNQEIFCENFSANFWWSARVLKYLLKSYKLCSGITEMAGITEMYNI